MLTLFTIYDTKQELPNDNEYVLAYFPHRPWSSPNTQQHKWVVVQFIKGLSKSDRNLLSDDNPRKRTYSFGDEEGNNLVPYEWDTFGPGSFFGQEASCWCHLPNAL